MSVRIRPGTESGTTVVAVALLMLLFSAVAFGAAILVQVELRIADRFRQSLAARYAAEAVVDVVLSELRALPAWMAIVQGTQTSPLADGAFDGRKSLPGGGLVALCCAAGSAADRLAQDSRLAAVPSRRALAWHPYIWLPFDRLAPVDRSTGLYVIAWVAGREVEDGGVAPAVEAVLVRADAMDSGGLRRTVEVLIERRGPGVVGLVSWREVR